MKKSTRTLIDKFLAERRKSQSGEYSPVMDEDLELFSRVIDTLISDKWQSDLDMDYPVEVEIVNRHTHERTNYIQVPYLHKCKEPKDFERYIHAVTCNANSAGSKLALASNMISRYMDIARKTEAHDE